jgi:hypothetical protein
MCTSSHLISVYYSAAQEEERENGSAPRHAPPICRPSYSSLHSILSLVVAIYQSQSPSFLSGQMPRQTTGFPRAPSAHAHGVSHSHRRHPRRERHKASLTLGALLALRRANGDLKKIKARRMAYVGGRIMQEVALCLEDRKHPCKGMQDQWVCSPFNARPRLVKVHVYPVPRAPA